MIGLAIVGVLLVRERGGGGMGVVDARGEVDLLLAATPVMVALAAALLGARGVRRLLGGLASLASRRRDLVPALAVRRSARDRQLAPILIVLVVATAVGTFAAATYRQLDIAAQAAAFQVVGAPYRATLAHGFRDELDPMTLPGVEAAAGATDIVGTTERSARPFPTLVLDAAAYRAVIVGMGLDPARVDPLLEPGVGGRPGAGHRLERPGVRAQRSRDRAHVRAQHRLARRWSAGSPPSSRRSPRCRRTAGSSSSPASRSRRSTTTGDLRTTSLFLDAPADAADALRAAIDDAAPTARVQALDEVAASVRANPVAEGVFAAAALSGIAVAAYAGLALVLALVMVGAARAVEGGQLRALGHEPGPGAGPGGRRARAAGRGGVRPRRAGRAVLVLRGRGGPRPRRRHRHPARAAARAWSPARSPSSAGCSCSTAGAGILLTAIMQYRSTPTEALRRGTR